MSSYLLAIDQGTTSTRALIFNRFAEIIGSHHIPLKQYFLNEASVEHDPKEIFEATLICAHNAIKNANLSPHQICALGISNQRETTLVWDKQSGEPIYPAIVWQDRRTTDYCKKLSDNNLIEKIISQKTGLLIDPYFSASKIHWILNHVDNAKNRAKKGELAFGTIDSYLLWKLTDGKSFFTDATNASRTLLFNIHTQQWDDELLSIFDIPSSLLPTVLDSNAYFGKTSSSFFGAEIPITGIAGDQHAAAIGQVCFTPGMIKSTFGTGAFMLLNTGETPVKSTHRLLTTITYRINNKVTYGLEGSIFSAGCAIKWLQENLCFMASPADSENLAEKIPDTDGVYFVPAFNGLGAPYWNPSARGTFFGLTLNTKIPHMVRAALEAVCYQTVDLMNAMRDDFLEPIHTLRVDGGMTTNNWFLQFLSNMLNLPIKRPSCIESTALGASFLAGLGIGIYSDLNEIAEIANNVTLFTPNITEDCRQKYYLGWKKAIKKTLL